MAVARVQVSIPYTSGLPSDVVTNTWHFESLDDEPINDARCAQLFARLVTFYNAIYTATSVKAMANYLAPALTVMKAYDLDDPKPRTAVREAITPLTVGTQQATSVASEAAVVLSYRTEYESGINKASQRGRIYLGGLTEAMITPSTASASAIVKTTFAQHVGATAQLLAQGALVDEWGWSVWSEKLQQSFAVAGGWVDNAIDTQRRRGQSATARYLWTD